MEDSKVKGCEKYVLPDDKLKISPLCEIEIKYLFFLNKNRRMI